MAFYMYAREIHLLPFSGKVPPWYHLRCLKHEVCVREMRVLRVVSAVSVFLLRLICVVWRPFQDW